jgi:hypothetical protein
LLIFDLLIKHVKNKILFMANAAFYDGAHVAQVYWMSPGKSNWKRGRSTKKTISQAMCCVAN